LAEQAGTNFLQRLWMSIVVAILSISVVWTAYEPTFRIFFPILVLILVNTSLWEFYQLAKGKGLSTLSSLGLLTSTLYIFTILLDYRFASSNLLPEMVIWISLLAGFLHYFIKDKDPYVNLSVTYFGILYLTLPLTFSISILYYWPNFEQDGRIWLLFFVIVSKATDVGAYIVGKQWGKNKLAPYISPKKTWEGSLGGIISSLIASFAFYYFLSGPHFTLSFIQCIGLGIILSILSQIGDLSESLLKRDACVKDSNHLPGLGGVLDMVDSLVFSMPFGYFYLKFSEFLWMR